MLTEKSTTSSAGHIERPVIDAAHDIQVIDSPHVAPVVDAAQLSGDAPNPSDFNAVWSEVMDQVASGTLTSDSPELLRLVEHLKQTGVLPANAMMDSDALMQFHFWFSSMPMDSVSSVERVVLEGALLQAWGMECHRPRWIRWWFLMPLMHLISMLFIVRSRLVMR